MKSKFVRDKNGHWYLTKPYKKWHQTYADALLKSFQDLDPIFSKAQEACEFEFILSILGIREIHDDGGWYPFDTLHKTFSAITEVKKRFDSDANTHAHLLLYGLIVEASEPYELLANLLNVIEGKRAMNNFPPTTNRQGEEIEIKPKNKIEKLQAGAKALGIRNSLVLFDSFYDNKLRNAVFHCSYSLYGSEIRIIDGTNKRIIEHEEKHRLMNGALAYYEALMTLIKQYTREYDKPIMIEPHPNFGWPKNEKIKLMVRKGHGVVGIRDNWTPEQIKAGYEHCWHSRITRHEQWLLTKNPYISEFPKDRTEFYRKLISFFPRFLRGRLVDFFEKYLGY